MDLMEICDPMSSLRVLTDVTDPKSPVRLVSAVRTDTCDPFMSPDLISSADSCPLAMDSNVVLGESTLDVALSTSSSPLSLSLPTAVFTLVGDGLSDARRSSFVGSFLSADLLVVLAEEKSDRREACEPVMVLVSERRDTVDPEVAAGWGPAVLLQTLNFLH